MTSTVSITETDILTALRTYLLTLVSIGCEIVKGQTNRVPSPASPNYVVMTPIMRMRLATNDDSYSDPFPLSGSRSITQETRVTIQLDVHGPKSADNAQVISTMLRDMAACDSFKGSGFDIQPLYTSDPRQLPFITGEDQYEDRWSLDVEIQANPIVTVPQDFAAELGPVDLIPVDLVYL